MLGISTPATITALALCAPKASLSKEIWGRTAIRDDALRSAECHCKKPSLGRVLTVRPNINPLPDRGRPQMTSHDVLHHRNGGDKAKRQAAHNATLARDGYAVRRSPSPGFSSAETFAASTISSVGSARPGR